MGTTCSQVFLSLGQFPVRWQTCVLGVPVSCQWARTDSFGGASSLTTDLTHADELLRTSSDKSMTEFKGGQLSVSPPSWIPAEPPASAPTQRTPQRVGYEPLSYGQGFPQGADCQPSFIQHEEELTTLWLGNLPEGTLSADVTAAFSPLGQVLVSSIQNRLSPQGSLSGFVRFVTREEADQALNWAASGHVTFRGVPCVARWARVNSRLDPSTVNCLSYRVTNNSSKVPTLPWTWSGYPTTAGRVPGPSTDGSIRTLFIGGLPFDTYEEEVAQTLRMIGLEGKVTLCQSKPSARGVSGFVRFDTLEAAEEALILMSEYTPNIRGQTIVFDWAKTDTFG